MWRTNHAFDTRLVSHYMWNGTHAYNDSDHRYHLIGGQLRAFEAAGQARPYRPRTSMIPQWAAWP